MSHVRRFDHVGLTVADLDVVTAFFVALGLEVEGRAFVEGEFLETVCGIPDSRTEIVMLKSPDDGARLELASFVRPDSVPGSPAAMANELGLRNVSFEVNDLQAAVDWAASEGYGLVGGIGEYEGAWRMAYVRGPEGIIVSLAERLGFGIGAEIMGANKFGPPGWQDDPDWTGWWGPNPPFHTPTFVLTHRPRPPIEMEGGTTFHFLDASPAEALQTAREAAGGQDVRIGGGPTIARDFIAAGLVDHIHLVQVPIVLGRGVRLWDGLEALEADYAIEAVSTPSGVTHLTFSRNATS